MPEKEFNSALKEQVSKRFEELYRKIGNNRQQLSTKVVGAHHELLRELNKAEVTKERSQEILREVSATEKMAAKQLPHLQFAINRPAPQPAAPKPMPKAAPAKSAEAPKAVVEKKAAPAAKKAPAKKAAPAKKK